MQGERWDHAASGLQQELINYLYDCHILPIAPPAKDAKPQTGPPRHKVLIAAAKKQVVDEIVNGARTAGFIPDGVVPGLVGPVNVFERSAPNVFKNEVVAIVDLGFKNSSICILEKGELALSRVVAIGGDKLTAGLAEAMNISYAEAEGIKVGMPGEMQVHLARLVTPLGRELRASIDFYEHQADKAVSQVFITGGSARSEVVIERLQNELMIECKPLNPVNFVQMELPPQQTAEIEQIGPQLTVALGAALAAL